MHREPHLIASLLPPAEIHRELGYLLRQVTILRRLLRLVQVARADKYLIATRAESEAANGR